MVGIFFASISGVNIGKVKINENNLLKSIVVINNCSIFVKQKRNKN